MSSGGSLYYLLSDQLGSTSITATGSATKVSEVRYKAWGEVRYTSGTTATKYTYTGQYSNMADFGLMFYNARWYDPTIAHFAQADSVVPDGVQGYDRYAYVSNNPLRYTDPTGHGGSGGVHAPNAPLSISMVVNLASSVHGSQYIYDPGEGLPSGYNNLCGDISLEMIYETATGTTGALATVHAGRPSSANGDAVTDADQVAAQVAASFPAGWGAVGYALNYVMEWHQGSAVRSGYEVRPISLSSFSVQQFKTTVYASLAQGHYLMLGVNLDLGSGRLAESGVGHWVVVSSVNDYGIWINNPYYNRREFYMWKQAYGAWGRWYAEVTPSANSTPTYNYFGPVTQSM